MNSLRAAPFSSEFRFGGKIQEALTADKDDQRHASLARNNSGQRQGAIHELRAISASWAYINNVSLSEVLQAAFWRNPTTFSSFYLRSLQCQQDNLYMLGPHLVVQT
ncbi:hypothetical protein DPMN_077871 [Dreissena polymorpha]|uniref:Uncharacterized protein n=1 Tax=Dreissena polymorpha TaxID=45954 RepID=A0A9D3YQ35_DREPO|nr:hypothetical protein DPMN_077871 [Dreissena polymorpha]